LRFCGSLNHTFSIVYNIIKFRYKVLLPKRSKFPAGLPKLVLNMNCLMVNNVPHASILEGIVFYPLRTEIIHEVVQFTG
jgi:hypothetical protein